MSRTFKHGKFSFIEKFEIQHLGEDIVTTVSAYHRAKHQGGINVPSVSAPPGVGGGGGGGKLTRGIFTRTQGVSSACGKGAR